jgi:predicted secreted protein
MIRHALTLAAMSLLACNGCNHDGSTPPGGPGTPPPGGETVIHVEDDGRAFDVGRGSPVTFKLASNAGTGFEWVPAPVDPSVLAQQGGKTNELASDVPGAPKMDVYRFVAVNPGSAAVEMDLKRPWGNQPPARAIHVTVNVH